MPAIPFKGDKTGEISGPFTLYSTIDSQASENSGESHGKVWSLNEARSALPEVRKITEGARAKFEEIQANLEAGISETIARRIEQELSEVFTEWSRLILEKGIHAKGPWLCDFDSGDGYFYCWKYPEEEISYFHLYESGFEGRRPVSFLKTSR